MKKYDYVILGGGISGLSFARLLQQHTKKSFIVIEKEETPGGLCRSINLNGNYLDIGGGHFLYSKHPEVYDFIFSHVPEHEFYRLERVTKILIDEQLINYPLEQHLRELWPKIADEFICSIIDTAEKMRGQNRTDFEGWVCQHLGQAIGEKYMIPYNQKVWGKHLSILGTEWLYKIPKVDLKEIVRSLIYGPDYKKTVPTHEYFYYPKFGGFQTIINAIYEPIKEHVVLGEKVESVINMLGKWYINGQYSAPVVINTIPWKEVKDFDHPVTMFLQHTSLVVDFYDSFKMNYKFGVDPVLGIGGNVAMRNVLHQYPDTSWTYIPHPGYSFHRVFNLKAYSITNPDRYFATETNLERWQKDSYADYYYINEYAYPVPRHNLNRDMNELLRSYQRNGVHGLGRWGTWKYHNSDVCIFEAMRLLQTLEKIPILHELK